MTANESRYELAGVLEEIPHASEFVADAARYAGLDDQEVYHCQLAVDEACTNIVEHGYGSKGADHRIQIYCHSDSEYFTIIIWDDGEPFNPLTRPDPDPSASLEERNNGGWGIYFIKNIMDEVAYSYDGRYNRLTMIKQIVQN